MNTIGRWIGICCLAIPSAVSRERAEGVRACQRFPNSAVICANLRNATLSICQVPLKLSVASPIKIVLRSRFQQISPKRVRQRSKNLLLGVLDQFRERPGLVSPFPGRLPSHVMMRGTPQIFHAMHAIRPGLQPARVVPEGFCAAKVPTKDVRQPASCKVLCGASTPEPTQKLARSECDD